MTTIEDYASERERTLGELSTKSIMILATSSEDLVTARSMSVIVIDDKVYFQTSKLMEKYQQITKNRNVALCINDIQIQGTARDIGPWDKNTEILQEYRDRHTKSYETYGSISSEIVIEIVIRNIKKWEYIDGNPYVCVIDFERQTMTRNRFDTEKIRDVQH